MSEDSWSTPESGTPGGLAGAAPAERWSARLAALAAGIGIALISFTLRPPLHNYDGYLYRLQALAPFAGDAINPHHLLWYPVQKAIAMATGALGSPSPEAFQAVGILVNALGLAWFCLLLAQRTGKLVLPFALTLYIALSPRIWHLSLQNQPYPLLDLWVVAFLWGLSEGGSLPAWRLTVCGAALGMAVLLQQGMALAVPAVALGMSFVGSGPWRGRLKTALGWAAATTAGITVVYLGLAALAGVRPSGFIGWTTMYLQEQHGIQLQWPQTAIKSAFGMVSAVVDLSWINDRFNTPPTRRLITGAYGTLLAVGCGVLAMILIKRRHRLRLLHHMRTSAGFACTLALLLAWTVFVILWEPAGYYWCVGLIPVAFLATGQMSRLGQRAGLALAGVLLLVSGWNLKGDYRAELALSVNYPPPMLDQIRAGLGPDDVFIIAGRDWYGNIDYDLLLGCLDDWPRDPAIALLDEYVMEREMQPWQQSLDRDIGSVIMRGGHVYLAKHVLQKETYDDLAEIQDPFSQYYRQEFLGVNEQSLQQQIQQFFAHYELRPSRFRIGGNEFWELKQRE